MKISKQDTDFAVSSIKQYCTKIDRECTSRVISCRTLDGANKLAKALVSGGFDIDNLKVSQYHYTDFTDLGTTKAEVDFPIIEFNFYGGVGGLHGKKAKSIQALLLKHKTQIIRITPGK